jgi:hypothetical protein
MYVLRNNVARSRNHCWNGKETMHFMCVVELYVTVNNKKILSFCTKTDFMACLCRWQQYDFLRSPRKNARYFLPDFNQILNNFIKLPSIKLYGNLSSGSHFDTWLTGGLTDGYGELLSAV